MTSRAKPLKTKSRRSSWESEHRQQVVVTIAFVSVIVLAIVILVGAVVVNYYSNHLLAVATVGGQGISHDEWTDRVNVLSFRLDEGEARLREAVAAGELDATSEQQEIASLEQSRSTIQDQALQGLIDDTLLAQEAAPFGLTVSDAEVSTRLQQDAATPEERHVQVLTFKPAVDAVSGLPSDAQKAAAQATAQKALTDLQAGKTMDAVATADGADASGVDDFGYISTQDTSDDPNLVQAAFALPKAGFTPVVAGQDGYLRIGQVTDIRAAAPDAAFMTTLQTY
ncbi:MAG: peptidylprolyl isomerase, partial [Candidatus Limnocylindrales bacterium]